MHIIKDILMHIIKDILIHTDLIIGIVYYKYYKSSLISSNIELFLSIMSLLPDTITDALLI